MTLELLVLAQVLALAAAIAGLWSLLRSHTCRVSWRGQAESKAVQEALSALVDELPTPPPESRSDLSIASHPRALLSWVDSEGIIRRQYGGVTDRIPMPPSGTYVGTAVDPDGTVANALRTVMSGASEAPYTLQWTDLDGRTRTFLGWASPWRRFDGSLRGAFFFAMEDTGRPHD